MEVQQQPQTSAFEFDIAHQDSYSRGQLLLRTFFGAFYMAIPHAFCLFFMGIAAMFMSFIAWWAILFTGKYPKSFFDFRVNVMRWGARLNSRIINLRDGYPAFGLDAVDSAITFNVAYPESLSRGVLLLRLFFAFFYVLIPHGFCLVFRAIACYFVVFFAWWIVLFTGTYPAGMHNFIVGTLRWANRVSIYLSFMTDTYPKFSSQP